MELKSFKFVETQGKRQKIKRFTVLGQPTCQVNTGKYTEENGLTTLYEFFVKKNNNIIFKHPFLVPTTYEQCCILWIFPCRRVDILFLWSSHMTFSHLKGNKYTRSASHACSHFPFHLPGELKRKHFTEEWRYNVQTTGIELDTDTPARAPCTLNSSADTDADCNLGVTLWPWKRKKAKKKWSSFLFQLQIRSQFPVNW